MHDFVFKEKERLKQEKRDEKRLNKERKLEQRRLELEMAKELKKPKEDMCLADQKVTPAMPSSSCLTRSLFPEQPLVSKPRSTVPVVAATVSLKTSHFS